MNRQLWTVIYSDVDASWQFEHLLGLYWSRSVSHVNEWSFEIHKNWCILGYSRSISIHSVNLAYWFSRILKVNKAYPWQIRLLKWVFLVVWTLYHLISETVLHVITLYLCNYMNLYSYFTTKFIRILDDLVVGWGVCWYWGLWIQSYVVRIPKLHWGSLLL